MEVFQGEQLLFAWTLKSPGGMCYRLAQLLKFWIRQPKPSVATVLSTLNQIVVSAAGLHTVLIVGKDKTRSHFSTMDSAAPVQNESSGESVSLFFCLSDSGKGFTMS